MGRRRWYSRQTVDGTAEIIATAVGQHIN